MADWYYTTNRQQMGPVAFDELCQLANRGLLKPTDLVWHDGMHDWVRASTQGLFADDPGVATAAQPPARGEHRTQRLAPERDDDDDLDDDRPRGRRRRRDGGMPVGVKVGLIVGGVVMLLVIVGVGLYFLLRPTGGNQIAAGLGNFPGFLNRNDPRDPRMNSPSRVYNVQMIANRTYVIELRSAQFDAFLRLEDSALRQLAQDDDGGGGLNSRIIFRCSRSDNYRVIATSLGNGTGRYDLLIRQN